MSSARVVLAAALAAVPALHPAMAADPPSVKLALSFRPTQKDVEYDTPKPAEYDRCKVNVERTKKTSGWIVIGADGQVIRRFVDTNADNIVDQWRYYRHGLEVYRDIDTNADNKVDQCRWLHNHGSRWGLDRNQDGRIDEWRVLSAAEATRVAVYAMTTGDTALLQTVLVSSKDVSRLGIESELGKKLLDSVSSPATKVRAAMAKGIKSSTKWMRFDGATPGAIPADSGKATTDLLVYENAMAIVETAGKTHLLQVGELVRVGEVWKLTQIPKPLDRSAQVTLGGILMQPSIPTATNAQPNAGSLSAEMQKVLTDLQKLDQTAPTPAAGSRALARYNSTRADLLARLIEMSESESDKSQWRRQMIDGLAAAVQTGAYPQGLARLQSIETGLKRSAPKSADLPYVAYRRMLAEYTVQLQRADEKTRAKLQQQWLTDLEAFAKANPTADDAPDAMLQLAIAKEFVGQVDDAKSWYTRIASDYSKSNAGARAAGAVRRLHLDGKPLRFSGPSLTGGTIDLARYRGKVVLVFFWSTWCKPCTEDLPQIKALYDRHRANGFEIVGVNLDVTTDPVRGFLRQHGVTWPQIHQPGGLDSEPGRTFGIISLPTMFLVDKSGKVARRATTTEELKRLVPQLLK